MIFKKGDFMELMRLIKQASLEAVNQEKLTSLITGTVISTEPLKIQVSQKLVLSMAQLILSRNVTDFDLEMTVDHETEEYKLEIDTTHNHGTASFDEQTSHKHIDSAGGETEESTISTEHSHADAGAWFNLEHSHKYKGKKIFKVHKALKVGEKVILIRESGGQRFYVIDRIGG